MLLGDKGREELWKNIPGAGASRKTSTRPVAHRDLTWDSDGQFQGNESEEVPGDGMFSFVRRWREKMASVM